MRFSINRAGLSRLIRSYLITLYGPCIVYGLYILYNYIYSIYELKIWPKYCIWSFRPK